ncbi:MAG: methyl-accepting chemotaxis protein [Paracoccaceae bacterium]
MRIRTQGRYGIVRKTTFLVLVLVVSALLAMAGVATVIARQITTQEITRQLEKNRDTSRESLVNYLTTIRQDLELWSEGPLTRSALKRFKMGWSGFSKDPKTTLQARYIEENPNPPGARDLLDDANDATPYSYAHRDFHPMFRKLKDIRGYYDIFLFNMEGDVIYSVFKERDFATNVMSGEFAQSGLGDVFRQAINGAKDGKIGFSDFRAYAPSNGEAASFIARAILDRQGNPLGVIAFQMPIDRIDARLGDQGGHLYSYLVGPDNALRNNDPRFERDTLLVEVIHNRAVSGALQGKTGTSEGTGLENERYLRAFAPLEFLGAKWAFVSEIRKTRAMASVARLQWGVLVLTLVLVVISALIVRVIAGRIANPIVRVGQSVQELSQGCCEKVAETARTDEIGDMARTVDGFRAALAERERLNAERIQQEHEEKRRSVIRQEFEVAMQECVRCAVGGDFSARIDAGWELDELNDFSCEINKLMEGVNTGVLAVEHVIGRLAHGDLSQQMEGEFDGVFATLQTNVNTTVDKLKSLIGELQSTTGMIRGAARKIASGGGELAERTESQAASLEETAATMEEMTQTLHSSAASSRQAKDLALMASNQASEGGGIVRDTIDAMHRIEESTSKISDIISVIDSIAFQTNLLALNAAVEAARAGDAGKGFAVVAAEVRALAQRTTEAAADITSLIASGAAHVQDGVGLVTETNKALDGIVSAVSEVAERISEMSTASEEQSTGVAEVSKAVSEMDSMTQHNASMVDSNAGTARNLADQADRLFELVGFFQTETTGDKRAVA